MSEDQYLGNLYQRFPVTIEKGLGSHVWDTDNNEYIDCMGGYGVALVGHRNERVVNAIKSQIDKVITVHSSFYSKTREKFLQTSKNNIILLYLGFKADYSDGQSISFADGKRT